MKEKTNRITVTVDAETAAKLDRLKQEKYYATTHAEMLRDLIKLGLQEAEKRGSRT